MDFVITRTNNFRILSLFTKGAGLGKGITSGSENREVILKVGFQMDDVSRSEISLSSSTLYSFSLSFALPPTTPAYKDVFL